MPSVLAAALPAGVRALPVDGPPEVRRIVAATAPDAPPVLAEVVAALARLVE